MRIAKNQIQRLLQLWEAFEAATEPPRNVVEKAKREGSATWRNPHTASIALISDAIVLALFGLSAHGSEECVEVPDDYVPNLLALWRLSNYEVARTELVVRFGCHVRDLKMMSDGGSVALSLARPLCVSGG